MHIIWYNLKVIGINIQQIVTVKKKLNIWSNYGIWWQDEVQLYVYLNYTKIKYDEHDYSFRYAGVSKLKAQEFIITIVINVIKQTKK